MYESDKQQLFIFTYYVHIFKVWNRDISEPVIRTNERIPILFVIVYSTSVPIVSCMLMFLKLHFVCDNSVGIIFDKRGKTSYWVKIIQVLSLFVYTNLLWRLIISNCLEVSCGNENKWRLFPHTKPLNFNPNFCWTN